MATENDNELIISWEAPLEPCPEGRHPIVCVDVFRIGPEEQTYDGVTRFYEKVMLVFQAFPEDGSRDSLGKPFQVERKFTWSLDPQGKFRPFLESWRGQDFPPGPVKDFDVRKLKGVSGWGFVEHNTRFVNLIAIEPYRDEEGKALPVLKPENYTRRNYKKPKKAQAAPAQPASSENPYDPIPSGADLKDALPF